MFKENLRLESRIVCFPGESLQFENPEGSPQAPGRGLGTDWREKIVRSLSPSLTTACLSKLIAPAQAKAEMGAAQVRGYPALAHDGSQ